jgi:23S rRNA (guanosine2251-2'-O)-methyltransferase
MPQIIYGKNAVLEWLKSGLAVEKIWLADASRKAVPGRVDNSVKVTHLSREKLTRIVGNDHHQGIAARIDETQLYKELDDLFEIAARKKEPLLVGILDSIQDPQNLGAIIRSADGAGLHGIIIPKDKSAGLTGVVFKASAGAVAHMAVVRVVNLARTIEALKKKGMWFAGADHHGDGPYYEIDFKGAMGIVMGSEGSGLRRLVREKCDFLAFIPMSGAVNSLNVSAAASLFFFEARRQRLLAVK